MNNDTPADAMELKPCPKCQINEAFVDKHRSYYAAECPRCGYWTEAFHTEAEAIAAWNTRSTSLAAQDGLVEALAYMLRVFDETNANDYDDVHLMVRQGAKITSIADCRAALASIEVKSS